MRAKKHFGQNFLHNPFILDRIVQASADLLEDQIKDQRPCRLIEIGVGLGDLSERLLAISDLTTYEIDADLCSFVLQKFSSRTFAHRFELVHRDVLSIPFDIDSQIDFGTDSRMKAGQGENLKSSKKPQETSPGWLASEPYILVSNLPYNIATRIVLNLLHDHLCKGFVVMTQKEVALKFCADAPDSDFCALSVLAQSVGEIELLFDVGAENFTPMPKVTSSVFTLRRYGDAHIERGFEAMLKAAFRAPRKKLYTNLQAYAAAKLESSASPKAQNLLEILQQESIPTNARPHQISTQKYHHIYNSLEGQP